MHWQAHGTPRGLGARNESYAGMASASGPCSGFVTLGERGLPCAGFRQCHSTAGTTRHNPSAAAWDVPLELRCAADASLTTWSPPRYLHDMYFYRHLPYDPVRPWVDSDGRWYSAISTDGCNASAAARYHDRLPDGRATHRCRLGGRLDLWSAPALAGPWVQSKLPLFQTNMSKRGATLHQNVLSEFVTSGYFGALPGDPAGGRTRVVTQNKLIPTHPAQPGATFWSGQQGSPSRGC